MTYAGRLHDLSGEGDPLSSLFRGAAQYWQGDLVHALETFQAIDLEALPEHGNAAGGWSRPATVQSWIAICAAKTGDTELTRRIISEHPRDGD
ncbi:MAG: hypothetical protein R3330_11855, partial [Saprospiraceae bacterium]|nr:hypothetical protein [Saprospiraceae bacterium]